MTVSLGEKSLVAASRTERLTSGKSELSAGESVDKYYKGACDQEVCITKPTENALMHIKAFTVTVFIKINSCQVFFLGKRYWL